MPAGIAIIMRENTPLLYQMLQRQGAAFCRKCAQTLLFYELRSRLSKIVTLMW